MCMFSSSSTEFKTSQVFASVIWVNQNVLGSHMYFNVASNISSTCTGHYLNPEQGASIAAPHK